MNQLIITAPARVQIGGRWCSAVVWFGLKSDADEWVENMANEEGLDAHVISYEGEDGAFVYVEDNVE